MPAGEQLFIQQIFQVIGDAPINGACGASERQREFRTPRAVLYRGGPLPGFRTALHLDFGRRMTAAEPMAGFTGLWLAERENRVIGCYGCERVPEGWSIGGRVIHDLPVFGSENTWVEQLAAALAKATVGGMSCSTDTADRLISSAGSPEHMVRDLLREALDAFYAGLDPDVMAAVRAEGSLVIAAYNHYWTADGPQRRARVQAALTHPGFSGALRNDWRLRRAVDVGAPLTQALAERYQVRIGTIKRTRDLAPGCIAPSSLAATLKRVDALSANAVPVAAPDWEVFLTLDDGLKSLAQATGQDLGRFLFPFAKGWRAGLDALEEQLQAPLDIDAVFEMMHSAYVYGLRPAVQEALAGSGSKATVSEEPPAAFFPLWFGRYGLTRLVQMSSQWREAHGRFSLERLGAGTPRGEDASLAWPGLLPAGASHGDLHVVELTSRQALELEGRRLEHCVASYAIKCLTADSCIFSIRNRWGQPLSTFDVRLPSVGSPQLLRHHAHSNAAPSAELDAMAQRFVERVLTPLPRRRIEDVRRRRRAIGARVRGILGQPNQGQPPLTSGEWQSLAASISFAHPSEARRHGTVPFLLDQGRHALQDMLMS